MPTFVALLSCSVNVEEEEEEEFIQNRLSTIVFLEFIHNRSRAGRHQEKFFQSSARAKRDS